MGGNGSRFSDRGYDLPKPLIPIYGKPFLYWSTQSILKFHNVIDITFVILEEHVKKYSLDKKILEFFPNAKIVKLNHVLNGPVLTCLEGVKNINDDYPVLFNDCDHLFKSQSFNDACKTGLINGVDGALITFKSNLPHFSYVKYSGKKVVGTVEKSVVSHDAICGAYLFKNANQFRELASSYLSNCEYNEYFISGMFNEMAKRNTSISIFPVDYHVPFGTPEEYEIAIFDLHYKELE